MMYKTFFIKALENHGAIRINNIYLAIEREDDLLSVLVESFKKTEPVSVKKSSLKYEVYSPKKATNEMVFETLNGEKYHIDLVEKNNFLDTPIDYSIENFKNLLLALGKEIPTEKLNLIKNLFNVFIKNTALGVQASNDIDNFLDLNFNKDGSKIYAILAGLTIHLVETPEGAIKTEEVLKQLDDSIELTKISKHNHENMPHLLKKWHSYLIKQ